MRAVAWQIKAKITLKDKMLELALHILDIAENSVRAKARMVTIEIDEDHENNLLSLEIGDDGMGMSESERLRALDPFYTTKKVRRVGLGLPMLAQAAERSGGSFLLESEEGRGTRVRVEFTFNHIDRQPLGDIAGVLLILIAGNDSVDFLYSHRRGSRRFTLDTREIKSSLEGVSVSHPDVLRFIRKYIEEGLKEIGAEC